MLSLADFRVPDSVEPIVAWRVWLIDHSDEPVLRSVSHSMRWPARQAAVASCHAQTLHQAGVTYRRRESGNVEPADPDVVPAEWCSCGIYAARSPSALRTVACPYIHGTRLTRIVGTVSLWGRVCEHSAGYKAKFAYPHELTVPVEQARLVAPLREMYGIPVRVVQYHEPAALAA